MFLTEFNPKGMRSEKAKLGPSVIWHGYQVLTKSIGFAIT